MSSPVRVSAKAIVSGVVSTIGAATTAAVAAHGGDIASLSLGEWALALAAGLTAFGGTWRVPNADKPATANTAAADVGRAVDAIKATDDLAAAVAKQSSDLKGTLASAITGVATDVFEGILKNAGRDDVASR